MIVICLVLENLLYGTLGIIVICGSVIFSWMLFSISAASLVFTSYDQCSLKLGFLRQLLVMNITGNYIHIILSKLHISTVVRRL